MASTQTPGFRPGSVPAWRKRLASVTRYIDDLEQCLAQANRTITTQALRLENQEKYLAAILLDRDPAYARLAELRDGTPAGRVSP
jgi:hypothetical protein